MAIPPAKLKAFVASIKEQVLDADDNTDTKAASATTTTTTTTTKTTTGQNEDTTDARLKKCLMALIRLELAQRGILWSEPEATGNDKSNTTTITQLLTMLQSTAGKPLLSETSSYPKPLLAGSAAMAGKMAEKVASLLLLLGQKRQNKQDSNNNHHQTTGFGPPPNNDNILGISKTIIKKEVEETQRRCREVEETRFLCLLEWLIDDRPSLSPMALWIAAEGYYYRAASFQPDVPLYWKRAWDVVTHYQTSSSSQHKQQQQEQHKQQPTTDQSSSSSSWHATYALEQLKRVATLKQNTKRASELSLKLVEAYLDTDNDDTKPTKAVKMILEAFCHPFRFPLLEPLPRIQALEKAQEHLSSIDFSSTIVSTTTANETEEMNTMMMNENIWLVRILAMELILAQEQETIHNLVCMELEKAQRRRSEQQQQPRKTTGMMTTTTTSLSTKQQQQQQEQQMQNKVRIQHYLSGELLSSPVPSTWTPAAVTLRDTALRTLETTTRAPEAETLSFESCSPAHKHMMSRTWKALNQILIRGRECMQVKTLSTNTNTTNDAMMDNYWSQIANFLQPLWSLSIEKRSGADDIPEAKETLKNAVLFVPCMAWMTLNQPDVLLVSMEILERTHVILEHLLEEAQQQVQEAKKSSTVSAVGSTQQQDKQAWILQLASLSTQALIILRKEEGEDDDNNATTMQTRGKTKRSKMSDAILKLLDTTKQQLQQSGNGSNYLVEFGTLYLGLLVCWNGLNESPFPFLTSKEALRAISQVRGTLLFPSSGSSSSSGGVISWNRPLTTLEQLWLDLSEADATGNRIQHAGLLYQSVLDKTSSVIEDSDMDPALKALVRAHTLRSLAVSRRDARSVAQEADLSSSVDVCLQMARQSLEELSVANAYSNDERAKMHLDPFRLPRMFQHAVEYQISCSRHQEAECLIQLGQLSEAKSLLSRTATEFPKDAQVAFAFGSFLLRMDFFQQPQVDGDSLKKPLKGSKEAQLQLLKAAKLDGSKAGPFALLGYWYESHGDTKRAVGCYSKALALDPAHPVAGRGLLRLVSITQLKKALDAAVAESHSSPVNGWAWEAIGIAKFRTEAVYELAVEALLRAARARDVEQPESDALSYFYSGPVNPSLPNNDVLVSTLSLIAQCYRFLGRYTASLRTYYAALNEAGENGASGSLLCACGQGRIDVMFVHQLISANPALTSHCSFLFLPLPVEMELGLFREATERFSKALHVAGAMSGLSGPVSSSHKGAVELTATLGLGVALLSIARIEVQDGKAGAALNCLQLAIQRCNEMDSASSPTISVEKLRGDLHSFGASLPLRAFASMNDKNTIRAQVEFVSAGEDAYRKAEERAIHSELPSMQASLVTDCATNILLRAQLLSDAGVEDMDSSSVESEFERSADEFCRALSIDGAYAPAWCGLGCAIRKNRNPLLAQHAWCRSIQLDPLSPDPYANLSFLYTAQSARDASKGVSETLTQVADTPMMWINRAFLLEKEARQQGITQDRMDKVVDAYRASLQVTTEPSALVGIAANGLLSIEASGPLAAAFSKWDIKSFSDEYSTSTSVTAADRKIIEQANALRPTQQKRNNRVPEGLLDHGFAQNLILGPHRADLWLRLAKDIVSKMAVQGDDRARESANASASKAVLILKTQLEEPSHLTRKEQQLQEDYVDADVLSEALIMRTYTQPTQHGSEDPEQLSPLPPPNDLQHALLMSPWNRLAWAALVQP